MITSVISVHHQQVMCSAVKKWHASNLEVNKMSPCHQCLAGIIRVQVSLYTFDKGRTLLWNKFSKQHCKWTGSLNHTRSLFWWSTLSPPFILGHQMSKWVLNAWFVYHSGTNCINEYSPYDINIFRQTDVSFRISATILTIRGALH